MPIYQLIGYTKNEKGINCRHKKSMNVCRREFSAWFSTLRSSVAWKKTLGIPHLYPFQVFPRCSAQLEYEKGQKKFSSFSFLVSESVN